MSFGPLHRHLPKQSDGAAGSAVWPQGKRLISQSWSWRRGDFQWRTASLRYSCTGWTDKHVHIYIGHGELYTPRNTQHILIYTVLRLHIYSFKTKGTLSCNNKIKYAGILSLNNVWLGDIVFFIARKYMNVCYGSSSLSQIS